MDEKIKINKQDLKIRKKWPGDFSPSEKIETPKPLKKSRSSEKQALKKALENLEDWDDLDI
jgi:hypothetical protein